MDLVVASFPEVVKIVGMGFEMMTANAIIVTFIAMGLVKRGFSVLRGAKKVL